MLASETRPQSPSWPSSTHEYRTTAHTNSDKHDRPRRVLHSPAHATLDPIILKLITLLCREHIQSWYSSISRDPDRLFINKVTTLLVHVVQTLEVRLAEADLIALLVNDIPALLERHVVDFDQALAKSQTGVAHNLDLAETFHSLQPHMAVKLVKDGTTKSSIPVIDKTYLRTLVDHLLKLLLPPEDYQSDTERTIVREIVVNIIFGNLFNRVAQPYFLHSIIVKLLESRDANVNPPRDEAGTDIDISSTPALEYLARGLHSLQRAVWAVLGLCFTSLNPLLSTSESGAEPCRAVSLDAALALALALLPTSLLLAQAANYVAISLFFCSSFVSALVYKVVESRVLNADVLSTVLENATQAMFPGGHAAPTAADPDEQEQAELERKCHLLVAACVPNLAVMVLPTPLPLEEAKLELARHVLRALSSHACNAHLMVQIVDLVVARLLPELIEVRPT
ncbi:hypothetical protein ACM66B_004568 [Microbotryomycetes sp. NB124-2]